MPKNKNWIADWILRSSKEIGVHDPVAAQKFVKAQLENALCAKRTQPNQRRVKILTKTNGHCWYCGVKLEQDHWVIEHQHGHHPKSKTPGKWLVPACYSCNNKKRDMSLEAFRNHLNVEKFFGEQ